jgi:hypothetical protein
MRFINYASGFPRPIARRSSCSYPPSALDGLLQLDKKINSDPAVSHERRLGIGQRQILSRQILILHIKRHWRRKFYLLFPGIGVAVSAI